MADVNVLLTCAGQRVDIVRAFREAAGRGHPPRARAGERPRPAVAVALRRRRGGGAAAGRRPGLRRGRRRGVPAGGRARGAAPDRPRPGGPGPRRRPRSCDAGAQAFLPAPEIALGCQDKWECHVMLRSAGLPSPPTWLPDEVDPADAALPGAPEAAPGLRRAPHLPLRRPRGARVLPRYSPAESVVQQALPGLGVQHRLPRRTSTARPSAPIPRAMIQSKGGEQIKGETLDDPQLVELGAATVEALGPGRPEHGPVLPRGRPHPGHHRHQHPLRRRLPAAPGGRGGLPAGRSSPSAPGSGPPPQLGGHRAGVVMTRFLDQTILHRNTVGARPPRPRGLGSAVVDREITLRDYGRVLWSGRWLILATTVVAAIVGLLLSFASTTTYTASAELFVGQATTISGTPVSTPGTNPAHGHGGPRRRRHRDPGGQGARDHARPRAQRRHAQRAQGAGRVGRQPAHHRDDPLHRRGQGDRAQGRERLRRDRVRALAGGLLGDHRQLRDGRGGPATASVAALEAVPGALPPPAGGDRRPPAAGHPRVAAQQHRPAARHRHAPSSPTSGSTWSRSSSSSRRSSPSPRAPRRRAASRNRTRTVVLAAIIGFLVGVIVTFVWRGSPAGRAGRD